MLLSLNFSHLSVEGYTSFILAIIFTIFSLACAIYFARHKKLSTLLTILIAVVFPMIAIFCWIYLLLTVLAQPLVNTLCISFACAVGYSIAVVGIAFLVDFLKKKKEAEADGNTKIVLSVEGLDNVGTVEVNQTETFETEENLAETEETAEASEVVENQEAAEAETLTDEVATSDEVSPAEEVVVEETVEEVSNQETENSDNTTEE